MSDLRIYLDNCCFNRPFDDQKVTSIYLETQGKLLIQDLIRDGAVQLIWSFILDYENSANLDETARETIKEWRTTCAEIIQLNEGILNMARRLSAMGFGKKDSLHLACARHGAVRYFITVDRGILKKENKVEGMEIVSPIQFLEHLEEGL